MAVRLHFIILGALLSCVFLAGCKEDEPFTVDQAIKNALGADNAPPAEVAARVFDESDPDIRRAAIEALMEKSWALRDPYLKRFAMLTNPRAEEDPSVRAVAVRALGKAGNTKYQPELIAALDDENPIVRREAATVLQRMPDDRAVIRLQSMAIADPSATVRAPAAVALRHYRSDAVFRTLLRCLSDEDFLVRSSAHESLVFQTGVDKGWDPLAWAGDPDELGREVLPEPQVRYRKRPWWDWMKVTGETESIEPEKDNSQPWWDWFGVTDEDNADQPAAEPPSNTPEDPNGQP